MSLIAINIGEKKVVVGSIDWKKNDLDMAPEGIEAYEDNTAVQQYINGIKQRMGLVLRYNGRCVYRRGEQVNA